MSGLKVRKRADVAIVLFNDHRLTDDELILSVSNELKEVLASAPSGTRMLLDFQNVEIVASMMLGDLVTLNKNATRKGVALQFCGLSPNVLRVIKSCQLDRLFEIISDAAG